MTTHDYIPAIRRMDNPPDHLEPQPKRPTRLSQNDCLLETMLLYKATTVRELMKDPQYDKMRSVEYTPIEIDHARQEAAGWMVQKMANGTIRWERQS